MGCLRCCHRPLLLLAGLAALGAPGPSLGQPSGATGPGEVEEEAHCQRVSEIVTANAAPVQEAPEATRLHNEARIVLRYLRDDCRGL